MKYASSRKAPTRTRINLEEKRQVSYWTAALNVTEARLHAAVQAAGTSVEKVRAHLHR